MHYIRKGKRLLSTDLVKVFSLNAFSTLLRMLTGMISVKVVSSIIGPSGIALLGQLNNFCSIILSYSNGGISNGITKYVAEKKDDNNEVRKYVSMATKLTIWFTLVLSALMVIFHDLLSSWILLSEEYGYVFLIFGFTLLLYSSNILLVSILNGYKEFKKYVSINILGTLFGLIFNIGLVVLYGLPGALISAVTFQSVVFFITLWMCRKYFWLNYMSFKQKIDIIILKQYARYSIMALVASTLTPISQFILRSYVITNISALQAGYWESMNRISGMYLMVVTTSFSIYYLPRLSEIKDSLELRREIMNCFKFIIPLLVLVTIVIYTLRHFVVWILFSPEFFPMESLFVWQLAGDVFKIASWLLAYVMVAKAMTKYYVITEIVFTMSFVLLGFVLVKTNGTIGLTQAYLINYIFYLMSMIMLFKHYLKGNKI